MIGKACVSTLQYYDSKTNKLAFKSRPVLIVGQADNSDYVILPISRVTQKQYLDMNYDIELDPNIYVKMNLTATSYVRTHKQMIVNQASIVKTIVDFKSEYEDKYLEIIGQTEAFQKQLVSKAL